MRAEQQIALVADGLADALAEGLAESEPLQTRLTRVERGVAAGGIKLHGREALSDIVERARRRRVGVVINRARRVGVGAAGGIEIGVAAQFFVNFTAEQRIDGLVDRLADNVPHRHLDARHHAHQRDVGSRGIAASVDVAPEGFDLQRI